MFCKCETSALTTAKIANATKKNFYKEQHNYVWVRYFTFTCFFVRIKKNQPILRNSNTIRNSFKNTQLCCTLFKVSLTVLTIFVNYFLCKNSENFTVADKAFEWFYRWGARSFIRKRLFGRMTSETGQTHHHTLQKGKKRRKKTSSQYGKLAKCGAVKHMKHTAEDFLWIL